LRPQRARAQTYFDGGVLRPAAKRVIRRFLADRARHVVGIALALQNLAHQQIRHQYLFGNDYDTTLPHRIIDTVRKYAISSLPGYENEPGWDLDRRPAQRRD
jgi:hypothetical protein